MNFSESGGPPGGSRSDLEGPTAGETDETDETVSPPLTNEHTQQNRKPYPPGGVPGGGVPGGYGEADDKFFFQAISGAGATTGVGAGEGATPGDEQTTATVDEGHPRKFDTDGLAYQLLFFSTGEDEKRNISSSTSCGTPEE